MAEVEKIDSNSTGLRFCEEESMGVLPAAADQVWYPLEPNSYSDFGGEVTTLARRPINASRQNQKGVVVDLDASGGLNQDLTQNNTTRLERGFFFADIREMFDTQSIDSAVSDVDSALAADDTYNLFNGDDLAAPKIQAQSLVLASGFDTAANNGVYVVNSIARVRAIGTLTAAANVSDGDTVTIGTTVYSFETGALDAAYKVLVGATASDSLDNLIAAINGAAGSGTLYATGTVAHTLVTAAAGAGDTMDVTAISYGTGGNAIATTEVAAQLSWGGATLTGGSAAIDVDASLTDELAPTSAARVQVVGYEFAVGTLDVSMASTLPRLVRASGAVDFTTLGLVAGQFIFIGGDAADEQFVTDANNGWARIHSLAAAYIELDKTTSTMVAEVGAALTIRIFHSKVLKNETAESDLIVAHSFQFERSLDKKDTAIAGKQGEYLVGGYMNEYTMNTKQADKLNVDMTIVAIDNEQRTQAQGLKSATAPATAATLVSEDAFNTTSHVARLRMTVLDPADANPTPLWGFCTEFTITINNNVTPAKAVSRLGAFAVTAGQFDVGGDITAYFSDVAAVSAVRANEDVSFDAIFARDNYGVAYDVPLCALGDARLNVEQDAPIMLPLSMSAAEDRTFHHTLLKTFFNYLPDLAMPSSG
jgi:hypothetical protein